MRTPILHGAGALALVAGSLLLTASEAAAGGTGCATCYRYAAHPPVYGSVSEQVMVRPPHTVHETIPPVFETVSEQVLVAPGGRVWQVTRGPYGEPVGCWVDTPPRYAVQTRRVMVRPPQTVPHVIPAAYGTVQRRVLVEPGRAGWEPIGGGYGRGGYGGGYGGPSLLGAGAGLVGAGAAVAGAGIGLGFGAAGAYGEGY